MGQHPLDNPAWHALTGPHAGLALGAGLARHYPRDMAPFSAVAEATPAAYADLARDLPPGLEARLLRPGEETPPPGWAVVSARPLRQMVADAAGLAATHPAEEGLAELGPDDVADMQALADAAKPGPFGPRTVLWVASSAGASRPGASSPWRVSASASPATSSFARSAFTPTRAGAASAPR